MAKTVPSRWALAAATAVLMVGVAAWPYSVDDAFIVARYARRLLAGRGYTFDAGPPSDGVTGPLWLLPMFAGVDAAKACGLLCMVASGAWVVVRSGPAAPIAAALVAVAPTLGVWGVAGLETGAATLAFTATGLCAPSRPLLAGIAAGSCAWLRPELVPAAAVALASVEGARRARAFGVMLFLVAAMLAWRLAVFEHPFLALRAKGAALEHGAAYVGRAALALFGVGGVVLALGSARRHILAAIATVLLTAFAVGGDWMPGYRLLAPVLPLYAWLAAEQADFGLRARKGWSALALAAALAFPALDMVAQLGAVRSAGHVRERVGRPLAARLEGSTVALVDIGYLGFRSRASVVDLGGLTDPRIALSPGGHLDKQVPIAYLDARAPDVILLHASSPPRVREGRLMTLRGHPVERRLAAHPWTRRHYRVQEVIPYASGYHYVWLQRLPR